MFAMLKKIPLWAWLAAGFFLLNCATYDWFTSVWNDEGMYADPAARKYFGHGFTSTSELQPQDEHWLGNSPLYPFLLFVWFKLAGFGIFQTRVFGYLLWSAATVLACVAVRRARLIQGGGALAALVVLLFNGYGLIFSYRSGRYDPLIFFLLAVGLLAFTLDRPGWRRAALFFTAALFMPTALTMGPFCAAFGGLFFLVLGRKFLLDLCSVAAGMSAGLLALLGYIRWQGLWESYRRITAYVSQGYYPKDSPTPVWKQKLVAFPHKLMQDPTAIVLLLALLAVLVLWHKKLDAVGRRLVLLGIATFFVIPAFAQAAYTFAIYHCWETTIPMAICLLAALDRLGENIPARWKTLSLATLAGMFIILGLGLRLGLESTDIAGRDYARVETFVRQTVRPADVVMADFQAFYPLHQLQATAYYYPYLYAIKPSEAGQINCLVINPGWLGIIREKIGGDWVATGESYRHENKFNIGWLDRLFPSYYERQSNHKYNLVVYRRVSGTGK